MVMPTVILNTINPWFASRIVGSLLLPLETNILSKEDCAAHEDYGDTDVDVEIVSGGSECPCN